MRLATDIFGHYLQENLDVVSYGVCEIFYETGDGHFRPLRA